MSETDSPNVPASPGMPGESRNTDARADGNALPWERKALVDLANAGLREQRAARRWNIAFKFLFLAYLVGALVLYTPKLWPDGGTDDEHTALVEVSGPIAADSKASADRVVSGLRAAFEDDNTKGVVLRINSPGGSPVQSSYINREIARLRAKHPDIPVHAVIADVCASGGYYVAVAADQIYANPSSLVGSIGVLLNGFGFPDAMDKLGVERRLLTAGGNKGFMDPFSPLRVADTEHAQRLLDRLHNQFIESVKRGRGDRLKGGDELFSGLYWDGQRALELGLVDEFASASEVARDVIGAEDIVDFTPRPGLLERITRGLGASIGETVVRETGLSGWQLR